MKAKELDQNDITVFLLKLFLVWGKWAIHATKITYYNSGSTPKICLKFLYNETVKRYWNFYNNDFSEKCLIRAWNYYSFWV